METLITLSAPALMSNLAMASAQDIGVSLNDFYRTNPNLGGV